MNDLSVKPRILFVTPVSPYSIASGAEQRSALMYSALCSIGTVDVLELAQGESTHVGFNDHQGQRSVRASLKSSNFNLARYRPNPGLTHQVERALGHTVAEYQMVVGRYIWPICQLKIPETTTTIVDLDDFKFRYSGDASVSWATAKERFQKFIAHRWVRLQLHRFDGAFAASTQDRKELSNVPTAFLPNSSFSECALPTAVPNNKRLVFVGSLWYRPNVEAVEWFLKSVWPDIRAAEPGATLILAGAAPPSQRTLWESHQGVTAPGFVNDLSALYQQANLVVAPIQSGGGSNIKVIEAMAHGRPCLTSSFVATAFGDHFVKNRDILIAKTPKEFAHQAIQALRNNEDLQNIATAGHSSVTQHFTSAKFKSRVADFFTQFSSLNEKANT